MSSATSTPIQEIMTAVSAEPFAYDQKDKALEKLAEKLDIDHDDIVTRAEISAGRPIKVFGYSWGSATAVSLTRDLNKNNIKAGKKRFCGPVPVDYLLSLDPVRHWFSGGEVVESNVIFYRNYYETIFDTVLY